MIFFSIGNEGAIYVKVSNAMLPIGVVIPSERGPTCRCNSCKYQKYNCAHIQHVLKLTSNLASTSDIPEMFKTSCRFATSKGTDN